MTIKVTTIAVIAIALIMSVRAAEDLSESVQVRLSKDFLINYFQEDDQYLLNLVQNIQIQDPSLEKAKGEISISVKPVGQFDKFNFDIVFQKPKTVIVTSNHCILHVEGASGSFSFELPIALLKYQTDLSGYIIDTPYNPDHKFEIKVEQAVVKNVKGITQDEAQSLANVMQSVLDKNTQNIMSKVYLWQDINADYTTKKAFAKLSSIIYLVAVTSKTIDGNQFLQLNGNPITEYFLTRNFTQIQKPTNWVEDPSAYNLQARLDDNFINSVLNLVIDIKGLVDIRYLLNLNGMPTDMLKVGTIAQAFGSLKDQYGEDAPFSVVFDFSENYLEKMLDWADGQPEKPQNPKTPLEISQQNLDKINQVIIKYKMINNKIDLETNPHTQEQNYSTQPLLNIQEGQSPDDIEDYFKLSKRPQEITCPFCGYHGYTIVKTDKCSKILSILSIIAKILLAIIFFLLSFLVIILLCFLCTVITTCCDQSNSGAAIDSSASSFPVWELVCPFYVQTPNSKVDEVCCNIRGSPVKRTHYCGECKHIIGYSGRQQ